MVYYVSNRLLSVCCLSCLLESRGVDANRMDGVKNLEDTFNNLARNFRGPVRYHCSSTQMNLQNAITGIRQSNEVA